MLPQHFFYIFTAISTFFALYIGLRAREEYKMFMSLQNVVRLDFFYFYTFGAVIGMLNAAYLAAYLFVPDNQLITAPIGILMRSSIVFFMWLLWKRPYNLAYIPMLILSGSATALMFSFPILGVDIKVDNMIMRPWLMVPFFLSLTLLIYLIFKLVKEKVNGVTKAVCVGIFFNALSSLLMAFSGAKFDILHLCSMFVFMFVFIPLFVKLVYIKN